MSYFKNSQFLLLMILLLSVNAFSNSLTYEETLFILSNSDEILFIDVELQNSKNFLDSSKNVSKIPILYENPYDLQGSNINILQYEREVASNHTDFATRLQILNLAPSTSDHATRVAGIMIGDGNLNSSYVGVAPEAKIYGYQEDLLPFGYSYDLESNYKTGIDNYSINVISNSYGHKQCEVLGEYNSFTQLIDELVYGNYTTRKVPIVWAVGNSQNCNLTTGYFTIAPEAVAKNTISVGNVYDSGVISFTSGLGPTNGGRIKPDLVAPGNGITTTNGTNNYATVSGTSMSAPHVSGTIALMLERWNKSGYDEDPLPSTIKALLLDSTTDLHRSGNGSEIIDGPDYVNGYGLLNAKGAVDRIINGTFLEANISDISNVDVYAINISAQSSLKVTLAWDDVPGANLINDLDLKLLSPTGQTFYPWTLDPNTPAREAWRNESDHLNNVEQVYVNGSEL